VLGNAYAAPQKWIFSRSSRESVSVYPRFADSWMLQDMSSLNSGIEIVDDHSGDDGPDGDIRAARNQRQDRGNNVLRVVLLVAEREIALVDGIAGGGGILSVAREGTDLPAAYHMVKSFKICLVVVIIRVEVQVLPLVAAGSVERVG